MKLFVFGVGYLGEAFGARLRADGWTLAGTSRDAGRRGRLTQAGWTMADPGDGAALVDAVREADAVLVTAAPTPQGCPGLAALNAPLTSARPGWIAYISSTAVYGDRAGGWVFEDSALNAPTVEGARRAAAERDWLALGQRADLPVHLFRLPAIYGPGRNVFDRLRAGDARLVKKPGQVFNRIHIDDIVAALAASLAKPNPGGAYKIVDDEPAPADVVTAWAARRLGLGVPLEVAWTDPQVSDTMRRFYLDSKRVSNARAKAELGWRPRYPTWREGLEAVLTEAQISADG